MTKNNAARRWFENDLQRFIDTANAPIFGIDSEGLVTEWNQKAESISGWTREETLGKPMVEKFISEEYRSEVNRVLTMALAGTETANYEFPLFSKDGQRRDILLNATTRRGTDGEITGVIGVGQDITELRSLRAEQHHIADDLSRLIETANAPIFGVSTDGLVTEWNRKAAALSGFSKEETLGRPLVECFITNEYKEKVQRVLVEACQGVEAANFEFPLVTKNGNQVDILLNATTRRDAKGNVTGVMGVGQDITSLRHSINETSHVADDLTRLIDTANAPIFGIDTHGNVSEWNQRAASICGWTKEEAVGKNLVEWFISADCSDEVGAVLTKALAGDETANFEFALYTKDGRRRELLLNATTRRGADGEVTGVIGVGQDITELRSITKEQHRIADDLQRLIETANAPIFGVNVEGLVTEWNKKAAELSGYSSQETMGKPLVQQFITEEYRERVQSVLTQACKGVETANFEFPLINKAGKRIDILLNATTRRDESGAVTGVVGVGQEITEMRKAMSESSLVADDLTRLIDTANAPIFGINIEGNVTEWNQKAAALSGWKKEESLGKPLVEVFIAPDYREDVSKVLSNALAGNETANYEFPLFAKDGRRRDLLLNATARRGADGEITGVIGVGQDITELRAITAEQHTIADDLSRLIDTANAPIFGVDTNGCVTEWNRCAADLSGYSKEETMGRKLVEEFITEEYKDKVQAVLTQAQNNIEATNFEFPLVTKDGKRIDILLNATTRRDAQGMVKGVVGVGQDITNLRQAMNETTLIADDLTRLIDTANAPIFGIDTGGRVTEWNQKAGEISGYDKQETYGKPLVDCFISEEYRQEVNRVLTMALSGNETANFEFPLFTKDGQRREILLNATTRRGADGAITGVIGVGQDITKLLAITAEQHRIADDLSRLIESANAPIFGVSTDGCVTEWNRKAAELSGFTKEETMGRPLVQEFITLDYREKVHKVLHQACQGIEAANFEFPLVTKDGQRIDILLNATTRRDEKGNVTGVVGVGQDITILRQAMNETTLVADDLMRLIDTANAPIFGIDTKGCVTEWNQMAAAISGYKREESIGKPLVERFISEEYRREVDRVLTMALKGEDTANFEFPLFTRDGQRREILLNATARRGADGCVTGVIGVGQDITEVRAVTAEQHRIADDLSRLIDTANAPIFGVSTTGRVTEWNRKAAELSGYSKEETLGRPLVEDFITSEYKEKVRAVLIQACNGEEAANFEFPLMTKDGKRIDILLNATTRRDEKENVTGVVGVGQDITNLRQAINETRRVADDLTRLIDTANAPIFGIDTSGCVTEWNQKAAQLSGWSKQETVGEPLVSQFISEDYRDAVNRVLQKALVGDETANFEFALFTKDGQRREILLNATTRRGGDGEITGVIGVGQDITELRSITAEQHRIADDLSRLIETANAPIFGVSVNGHVTEWNKKAAELSGYAKEETMDRPLVEDFITVDYKEKVQAVLTQACRGVEAANFEFPLVTKDGKRIDILLNATTRRDEKGEVTGVVGVGQDITNLRQAMNQTALVADDLTRLIDTANAPIFGIDTEGRVTEWNQKAAALSGWEKTDTVGKPLVEYFISEEYRPEVKRVLEEALNGKETANFEFPLFTRFGQRREILLNATTRCGADGRVTGVIGVGQDISELRAITAEQHRIADDLSRLIDSANAPIFGVSIDGRVTEWNRKAAELSGYSKQETMGRPLVQDFITSEFKAKVQAVLTMACQGEEKANFEFPLVTKDGKRIDILLNATTRRDEKGIVTGVVGVGQDITNLRQAMNETLLVADDLTRLIDTANAPIFGIGTDGRVTEWNQKAAALSGWVKEEAVGKPLVDSFISEDYRKEVSRVLTLALQGSDTANFEFPLFTKHGQRREILLNATTRRGANGEIQGVIGVGQDITELRSITAEQHRIADDLSRLIETANAPIFGVSTTGRVTEWNRKAAELSGYSKQETLGRPLVEHFITAEYKEKVQTVLTQAINGQEAANFEFPLVTKDGKQIGILLNATTRRDEIGEVTGVVGVGQDITNLRQAMNETTLVADDLMRLIDTANAPIFGIDTKGRVNEWNQMAASIAGWDKSETVGKPLVEKFITAEYRQEVSRVLTMALQGKETANFEFPLFTKNGLRREILLNATTRRGADGAITGVIGVGQDITEVRAVTAEQHRIADDLSRLIDTANAPIFGVSTAGRVTEWNRKAAELSGYPKEETLGRPLVEHFITAEYKEKVQAVLTMACQGEEAANFEFPLVTKDGKRIDILLNATTRRDEKGEITGVVGVGQDITNLRQAMTETRRVADDLTRLIDHANAPIFGIDTEGRVTEWNQKAASLSGWTNKESIGKPLVECFISENYREMVNGVLVKALAGDETANFEFPLFTKDGQRREILLNATTRRGADGEVIGVIGVGQDISELRAITAEQHRIAEDLARLIDSANAPIFGVGVDGRVTEWNKKAAELSGYSKQETMGRPLVEDFIILDYKLMVQAVLTQAMQGVETANFEFPLITKEGKRIEILLNATTRRDEKGEVTGVVGVGQDITNLRQAMNETTLIADDLTRLIDTANAPIFGIDTEGCVTEWNQKSVGLSGWNKEETVGKQLVECFISEDYRAEVKRVLEQALAGDETANFEFPLYTRSGQRRDILLNATTRRGADGEVTGVIGVGQDISELRAITAEQHRIADDLSRLIDTANAPIFGVSTEGCVTEWNRKAAELSGYSKEETMGRPLVEDFITLDYKEKVQAVLTMACKGEEAANFEFPLVTKDGKRIDILLNATTRRDEKGVVTGVVGVGQDITNLRQAMNETERIADDLTRLIDTANAPIFGIDTKGYVEEWNQKAASLSGWEKGDTYGKPLVQRFISEDYREEVDRVLGMALAGIETANFEFPLFTKDMQRRDILLNATPRRGADGEVIGVIGVGQDITELRSITAEQHRIADDLSRLIETANAPIFGVNKDCHVTEWNRKAADLSGYSKAETMGRPLVDDFITEEYKEKVQAVLSQACHGEEAANFEFPLMTKDGKRIDILLNATTRRDEKGDVTGVVGVGQDITNFRKLMNETTRIADDLMRLIDTANAPIFGVDTAGRVTEWNQRAAEISGWQKEETVGKPLVQTFISAEYRKAVDRVLKRALEGDETANYEFPLFTKDGQRREILLNATTRRGADGSITGVIGVGQDITELRALIAEQHRIADDLSRLIETANAPIFGVNVEGKVTEWNKKAAELSGYSKEETLNKPLVQEFISCEYQQKVQMVLNRACEGCETANFEFPLLTKAGQKVHILLNATARRDAANQIIGVVGVGQDITELGNAMTYSKSVAEDLARLVDTANAPIFGIDTYGNVTEWNRMASKLTGYDKRSVIGKPMVESFIHVDEQDAVREVFERALQGLDVNNFDLPLYTRKGDKREILLNATSRRGQSGEITGVVGVGQDITELNIQRRMSERIAKDLARLIDTANAPIFGADVQGCVTEWNRKAAALSGYSKEEILGQRLVQRLVVEDYQHQVAYVLLKALSGEETSNFEFPLITKAGEQRDMLMNATATRGGNGDVTGVIGVGHDITEIRQMAVKQRHIAEDLARLIRSANAPIFGVNTQGEVTEWNDKAAVLSGYTREEALGKPLVETFILEDNREQVGRAIEDACHGIETTHFEFPLIHKDGSLVLVLLNAATRKDASGEVVGMIGIGQDITTLRQAMNEISRVADDLRRIIEHANAPIFGIDTEGKVTEWNQKVAEISLLSKEEMLGKPLVETFIREEYREDVDRVLKLALEGMEMTNYEFPLFTRDGGRYEILFNATTRRGADGKVTGVIGVGQDITKLRKITMEHQRIADDLQRLIETANAPIFGVDTHGRITEWNRKAVEISGFTKEDTFGQSLVKHFIHKVHQNAMQEVFDKALASQVVTNFELILYTRSGERRDILLNATPRWGSNDEVIGVVCVGQDITDLHRHRQKAERIAEDLSQLIDTANAPIFGVDKSMCINEWNGWVAKNSGFSKETVLGNKLTTYIAEQSHHIVNSVFNQACKGKPTSNFEVELAGKRRGTSVCLLLNATPRLGPQGDIIGIICVGQDITNIKEVEQKKSAFMAMVGHELKSPLHGIVGLSSSMADTEDLEPQVQKPLQMIHSCATRLLDMVSNIMDASVLVQDRKMRFSRDTVQMTSIVEEVIILCQHSIDKRGNPVVKQGVTLMNKTTPLPMIEADSHRCTQLIYNLVTNALKFTHEGHVCVYCEDDKENEDVHLTVEDTGIGIAKDNLDRIFKPFDQEDQSEQRRYDGLGLGLAICKEVAQKHGGKLYVESTVGKGSKFHVRLPYKMTFFDHVEHKDDVGRPVTQLMPENPPEADEKEKLLSSENLETKSSYDELEPPIQTNSKEDSRWPVIQEEEAKLATADTMEPKTRINNKSAAAGTTTADLEALSEKEEPERIRTQDYLDIMGTSEPSMRDQACSWTILSVDDDEVNQEVIRATLGKCGCTVAVEMNGAACIKYIEDCGHLPDLILLDLMMPGISGLDVLTELRKVHSPIKLPIIMVSAKNSTSAVVKGLSLRCNDWVHKPFDRLELIARVKTQILLKDQVVAQTSKCVPNSLLLKLLPRHHVERLASRKPFSTEEINFMKTELGESSSADNTEQNALREMLRTTREQLKDSQQKLALAQKETVEARCTLQQAQADLEWQRAQVATAARAEAQAQKLEKSRNSSNPDKAQGGSASTSDSLEEIAKQKEELVKQKEELAKAKESLGKLEQKEKLQEEKEKELEQKLKQQEELQTKVARDQDQLKEQQDNLKAQQAQLREQQDKQRQQEKTLHDQEKSLQQQMENLQNDRRTLQSVHDQVDKGSKDDAKLSETIRVREKRLKEQEEEYQKKEEQYQKKRQTLDEDMRDLQQREADLKAQDLQVQKQMELLQEQQHHMAMQNGSRAPLEPQEEPYTDGMDGQDAPVRPYSSLWAPPPEETLASVAPQQTISNEVAELLPILEYHNQHLQTELRTREQQLIAAMTKLNRHEAVVQMLEQRCAQLELTIRHLQVDRSFFGGGLPALGGGGLPPPPLG